MQRDANERKYELSFLFLHCAAVRSSRSFFSCAHRFNEAASVTGCATEEELFFAVAWLPAEARAGGLCAGEAWATPGFSAAPFCTAPTRRFALPERLIRAGSAT
jgi:hypothetical protein